MSIRDEYDEIAFSELLGKTIIRIVIANDKTALYIDTDDLVRFRMSHHQDCCEHVSIEDIAGDLGDLLHSPIIRAEANSNDDPEADEHGTWTYYKFDTANGDVTIRWYGSSNGYYSESVEFEYKSITAHNCNDVPTQKHVAYT